MIDPRLTQRAPTTRGTSWPPPTPVLRTQSAKQGRHKSVRLWATSILPVLLAGCFSAPRTFYDVECRTQIPEGVSVALLTLDSTVFLSSTFGGESIHVGFGRPFPDTILVGWRGSPHAMYKRTVPLKPLLPPINPRKEKYHLRFTFYPGDSVRVQARKVAKYDCRHTVYIGATSILNGPCGNDGGTRSRYLDSLYKNLVPKSTPAVFPDD